MSLVVLSFALTLLAADGAARSLPAYADALNCAGVTQAASKFGSGPENAKAFDSAMFWSLAAMEVARTKGMTAAAAQADQDKARDGYKALLDDDDANAWADLAGCLKATPPAAD